jgi:hypothetical protein
MIDMMIIVVAIIVVSLIDFNLVLLRGENYSIFGTGRKKTME